MDVASDYCENVKDERPVNILQGSTSQVKNVIEPRQVANGPMQLNESVVRVTTEPRTTRNVWIRLKQHKWTILAFVCGAILTLVIVVLLMVSKSSSTENDNQTGYLFSLKFDRDSTYSSMFLSDDNTVLGNSFTKETPNPVNHPKQFNTYRGTVGDRCLTSTTNHLVANTDEKVKVISSSDTTGTVATGRLGFFINMNRNEFSVIDKDSSKILFTLRKVVSADQLCLAFGVYNPHRLQGKLEIMYSYDFTNLPIINVVA
ncbi:unnamed protein product [Mytilus edulis]|uniref:Uncharacterized protein n=1 Tax=Mytilus edulis TaxID=6550 RepID=A0A8S3RR03_MYTED|nr:unnamed protein product [Mytilus edulis]